MAKVKTKPKKKKRKPGPRSSGGRVMEIVGDGLTPLQFRFCQEYLIDLNASQAYMRAGFACKSVNVAGAASCNLLRNPKIISAIQKVREDQAKRLDISATNVLRELARLAFSDSRKLYRAEGSLKPPADRDWETW